MEDGQKTMDGNNKRKAWEVLSVGIKVKRGHVKDG